MSPITPEWWYDPTSDPGANLTFDITAANALLDAAGYDGCQEKLEGGYFVASDPRRDGQAVGF